MFILIASLAVAYLICAALAYGLTLAYWQQHYYDVRSRHDWLFACLIALIGPLGIGIALLLGEGGHHGLQWRATDATWRIEQAADRPPHPRKHGNSTPL